MPTVRANDVDVHYKIMGDGPPLLLIAGFACDLAIWAVVARKLADHFRVLCFDNRGTGRSSSPDAPYAIEDMASDTVALLEALGVARAHVAGHSMGGQIAQEIALRHPEKVCTLTLIASCTRPPPVNQAVIRSWGDLPRQVDPITAARLSLPWIYTNRFYAQAGMIENVIELLVANPSPLAAHAVLQQSRAICDFDPSARLGRIQCPTLAIAGQADILLPVACSEELVRGIPGALLEVIPDTGHGMLVESPRAVAAAMLKFLLQHPWSDRQE